MANGIPGLLGIETEPSEDKNFSIKKAIDNHSTIEEYIRYQSLKKQYKKIKTQNFILILSMDGIIVEQQRIQQSWNQRQVT